MNYVYLDPREDGDPYTVGFYAPDGKWMPESDHRTREAAAERVHYLNGNGEDNPVVDDSPEGDVRRAAMRDLSEPTTTEFLVFVGKNNERCSLHVSGNRGDLVALVHSALCPESSKFVRLVVEKAALLLLASEKEDAE